MTDTPQRFTGKTIVVTGAASGIGRATAARIAQEGGYVVAVDSAAERLQAAVNDIGSHITPIVADITNQSDIDTIAATAGEKIDGLANIAGITDDFTAAHEVSDATWQRVMAVNLDGTFRLTRAVLSPMLAAGRGSIVNITSEAGLRGSAAGVAYTTSKHAVIGFTRSCAFMYGPSGIRVNAVAPGGVATGLTPGATGDEFGTTRLGPFFATIPPIATPEQLAAPITFLLSDDAANISGAILPSDGGWSVQ